ncbi:MAG: hypothetical protein IKW82_00635 [Bacteroidales bacterium]|nr:hypothetical protein [Bacteroidales bacterium]
MKKVTKFFMAAVLAGMCSVGYAQDYLDNPKTNEKLLGTIALTDTDCRYDADWYARLLTKAKQEYPNKVIDIRKLEGTRRGSCNAPCYYGPVTAKVVEIGGNPEAQSIENLSKAMDKAFRNVREGSRVAIDMVTVSGGVSINREDLKDQIIDALLDKGYKVVAKDYLEKMYEEQEAQQSGIYNENTTVKENNFSAVGYYINVKVTETSLRVQVVNVSTGEYEGNATVNF